MLIAATLHVAGLIIAGHPLVTHARRAPPACAAVVSAPTSAFAKKHTSRALNEAFLSPVELDGLDRVGKIVATLGPASQTPEMLEALIKAGVDVFRLNSSHRRPGQFEELIPNIRRLAKAAGREVKILGDIQGPKFRCSMTLDDAPVALEDGSTVEFCLAEGDDDVTRAGRITLSPTTEQTALLRGLEPGMRVLLDDGFMEVKVLKRNSASSVSVQVVVGGGLKSRKGINVPTLQIDCAALTLKDREDAQFLLTCPGGVDYIAISFAQKAGDIQEVIDIMDKLELPTSERPAIIPKIEKPAALANIDEILSLSDGLMVARGDLGVELGLHRVPFAQARRAASKRPPLPVPTHVPTRRALPVTEIPDPQVQRGGQVLHHGDPDDGIHDHERGANAGRGLGRGGCHL